MKIRECDAVLVDELWQKGQGMDARGRIGGRVVCLPVPAGSAILRGLGGLRGGNPPSRGGKNGCRGR